MATRHETEGRQGIFANVPHQEKVPLGIKSRRFEDDPCLLVAGPVYANLVGDAINRTKDTA